MASSGLSALSKQLRFHRQRADKIQLEKEALERQLRIALDLRGGLSVRELAKALAKACKDEAEGELKRKVRALELQNESEGDQRENAKAHSGDAEVQISSLEHRLGQAEIEKAEANDECLALRQQLESTQSSLRQISAAESAESAENLAAAARVEAAESHSALLAERTEAAMLKLELEQDRALDLEGQLRSLYFAYDEFVAADALAQSTQVASMRANQEEHDMKLARQISMKQDKEEEVRRASSLQQQQGRPAVERSQSCRPEIQHGPSDSSLVGASLVGSRAGAALERDVAARASAAAGAGAGAGPPRERRPSRHRSLPDNDHSIRNHQGFLLVKLTQGPCLPSSPAAVFA